MRCNVAFWDQILRFSLGFALVTWAVAGGPSWAFVGIAPIATAAWRICPAYSLMRISTLRHPDEGPAASPGPKAY
jgi:hypothetical protein